jgi:DNA-binding CsgD family transcriptional regulator
MALGSASRRRIKPGVRLVKLVGALDRTRKPEIVRRSFQNFIESFGFTGFACVILPASRQLDPSRILMSTLPADWMALYVSRGFASADPMVRELLRGRGALAWSDVLSRRSLSRPEREVLSEAARFGIRDGFIVPIRESGGSVGLVSLVAEKIELDASERNAIIAASVCVHQKLCALKSAVGSTDRRLSPREIEILHWTAEGKSDWQIGRILAISAKTVNYHIENAKRKFGVATRVQAVVSAIQQGELRR